MMVVFEKARKTKRLPTYNGAPLILIPQYIYY